MLVILAAIDAAFSGDWSRIGAISTDTELWLQSVVKGFGIWNLAMGVVAYTIASQNSWPRLPATAKVMVSSAGYIKALSVSLFLCHMHAFWDDNSAHWYSCLMQRVALHAVGHQLDPSC